MNKNNYQGGYNQGYSRGGNNQNQGGNRYQSNNGGGRNYGGAGGQIVTQGNQQRRQGGIQQKFRQQRVQIQNRAGGRRFLNNNNNQGRVFNQGGQQQQPQQQRQGGNQQQQRQNQGTPRGQGQINNNGGNQGIRGRRNNAYRQGLGGRRFANQQNVVQGRGGQQQQQQRRQQQLGGQQQLPPRQNRNDNIGGGQPRSQVNIRSKGIRKFRAQNGAGILRGNQMPNRPVQGQGRRRLQTPGGQRIGGGQNKQLKTLGQRSRPQTAQQNNTNGGQQQQTPRARPQNPRPTEIQLKALQVKAELNKLGDAPRAYLEKLKVAEEQMEEVQVSNGSKLSLNERFEKIQGVRITPPIRNRGKTLRLIPGPKVANRKY